MQEIVLLQLADGHSSLTPSAAVTLAESAAVCLADQRHDIEAVLSG